MRKIIILAFLLILCLFLSFYIWEIVDFYGIKNLIKGHYYYGEVPVYWWVWPTRIVIISFNILLFFLLCLRINDFEYTNNVK